MKAIIPAAGHGTRMRCITHSQSKELMKIAGNPLIYYSIKECLRAGIDEIIIIVNKNKQDITEYINKCKRKNIFDAIDLGTPNISVVIQEQANGSGGAILAAKDLIGSDNFAVLFPDIYVEEHESNMKEMCDLFESYNIPIILVDNIKREECNRYGITIPKCFSQHFYHVEDILEKPSYIERELRFHGIVGRYILNNSFLKVLESVEEKEAHEKDFTSGLLLFDATIAKVINGHHFECGTAEFYLKAKAVLEETILNEEEHNIK